MHMEHERAKELIVTVKALAIHDGKLLVCRQDTGRWDVPGGRLEVPELLEETLRREVREELGVEIAQIDRAHSWVWDWTCESKSRPVVQSIVGIGFPVRFASNDFQVTAENLEWRWASMDALRGLPMHEGHRAGYLGYLAHVGEL